VRWNISEDQTSPGQELLRSAGLGRQVSEVLRALIAAGLLSRQPNGSKTAASYRLLLP
jgi:hypothetical protein